jgi:hypothetical protein
MQKKIALKTALAPLPEQKVLILETTKAVFGLISDYYSGFVKTVVTSPF